VLALGCVVAIPWTVGALRRLLEIARAAMETTRWARSLDDGRTERAGDVEVRVSPSVGPRAFTVGAWRSAIVVGTELWAHLEPDARRALALHEHAHAVRRDALTLLCLRVAACAMPAGPAAELLAEWRRSAEETCDRLAAQWHGDPFAVAAALVACGKLQAGSAVPTDALVVGATDGDDLEARVLTLLEPRPNARARAASDLVVPTLGLGLGLVAFMGVFGDVAHHAVETVLGLIA
jgi:Zn-dependent protease with chaperone function